jgi:TetR/AcrR family transcriptional repressor of nem operon
VAGRALTAGGLDPAGDEEGRARAIFAAIAGAQLVARGGADLALYDALIESYRAAGLLPA